MGSRSRAFAMFCAATLALATTTLPASATGGPTTITDGLAFPLSVDNGSKGRAYVTGGFGVSQLTEIGASGTASVLAAFEGEITGVTAKGNDLYYIQATPTESHLMKRNKHGATKIVSHNFIAYEAQRNPDRDVTYGILGLTDECKSLVEQALPPGIPVVEYKGIVESHAYQTSVYGNTAYVADAAANAILKVDLRTKRISTVAVLPPVEVTIDDALLAAIAGAQGVQLPGCINGKTWLAESVPTDVKKGTDGQLYVSTLAGIPGELLPYSGVSRVNPWSGKVKQVASGLHGATGLDIGKKGDIYVAELFGQKVSIIRRGSHKARTLFETPMPSDVAVDGKYLLVTNNALHEMGNGGLIRYRIG